MKTPQPETTILKQGEYIFHVRAGKDDSYVVDEITRREEYGKNGCAPEEGEVWLDLGAHIGTFSVWAARRGALVTAIEPFPENQLMYRMKPYYTKVQSWLLHLKTGLGIYLSMATGLRLIL